MSKVRPIPFINHEFDGRRLVSDLCNVPDAAALTVAKYFEDSAAKLKERHELYMRSQELKANTRSRTAMLYSLPGRTLNNMLGGNDYETAAVELADRHGVPRETMHHYWLGVIKQIEERAKAQRADTIWEMYQDKYSNKAISEAVGLSIRQIGRVIRDRKTTKRRSVS